MSRKQTEKGKHWTDRDKLKAIAAFSVLGNASLVEKETGISAGTINYWKTLPWWFEEMEKLRRSEDEALVSGYTKIMQQTINKLQDRIEQGDIVVLKDGGTVNKPVSARDLATISGVIADKRQKIRNDNKEVSVKSTTTHERLQQLAEQFAKFITSKVVDGVVVNRTVEIEAPKLDLEIIDAEQVKEIGKN